MPTESSAGRRRLGALRLHACAAAILLAALVASGGGAGAATSNVTVTLTVASASFIDSTNCASGQASRTSFGTVLPGSKVVTPLDCDIEFGSSNDTASLHAWQTDQVGSAMARPSPTWTTRASGTAVALHDVQPIAPNVAWVAGASGEVLRTANGGANWTRWTSAQTGTAQWLYGITATDAATAWAVGGSGTIIKTTTSGTSWVSQSVGGAHLNDIEALDASTLWTVGNGGRILKSTNGGSSWTPQVSGTANDLWELDIVSDQVIWVVGTNGTILRTIDGGATWTLQTPPVAGQNNRGIAALDANRVWVGDSLADVSYSANAGGSWTRQLDRDGGVTNIYSIDVVDGATLFTAAGNGPGIDRSFDLGATWSDETPGGATGTYAVGAIDSLTAYAVGLGGAIYTSNSAPVSDFANDGSADWDTVGTTIDLFGACLRDAELGASGGGGGWIEDTNTGADCADGDSDPWNAIPTASPGAKVASTAAPDAEGGATDPVAHLRFGVRTEDGQAPGRYLAPVTFQVIAPAL